MIITPEKLKLIKANNYEYSQDELNELYKLANFATKKYSFSFEDTKDMIQDIVTSFLFYSIKKFDLSKNLTFTTFAIYCMNNFCLMKLRKLKNPQPISSDADIEDESDLTFKDCLPSFDKNGLQEYEYTKLKNQLTIAINNDMFLKDYYINNLNQVEIAKKYNISQSYANRIFNEKLKKLKNELLKKGFDRGLEDIINDDSNKIIL